MIADSVRDCYQQQMHSARFDRRALRRSWQDAGILRVLRGAEKAVLMEYLRRANHAGESFPSGPMLARDTGYSTGQVKRARSILVRLGLLQRCGTASLRGRQVIRYRVCDASEISSPITAESRRKIVESMTRRGAPARRDVARAARHVYKYQEYISEAEAQCAHERLAAAAETHDHGSFAAAAEEKICAPGSHAPLPHPGSRDASGGPFSTSRGAPVGTSGGECLFDAEAAVELMCQDSIGGGYGWQGAEADARRIVKQYGPDLVRRAVQEIDWRIRQGRHKPERFRGGVVAFCRDASAGAPWVEENVRVQQRAFAAAEKARLAQERKQREEEQHRAQLQAAEDRDELLWSQLSREQREELHRAVCAELPYARKLKPDNRMLRSLMLTLWRTRTPHHNANAAS